jgi:tripartite-type tricarboxylate transporter receptor subunit TctC
MSPCRIGSRVTCCELREASDERFGRLAGTSQELAAYIKDESAEWRRVVREAKINVD